MLISLSYELLSCPLIIIVVSFANSTHLWFIIFGKSVMYLVIYPIKQKHWWLQNTALWHTISNEHRGRLKWFQCFALFIIICYFYWLYSARQVRFKVQEVQHVTDMLYLWFYILRPFPIIAHEKHYQRPSLCP